MEIVEKSKNDTYTFINKLNEGGAGETWLATNSKNQKVVIKIYKNFNYSKFYFEKEKQNLLYISKYCNEYAICYIDGYSIDDNYRLVMNYIEGYDLYKPPSMSIEEINNDDKIIFDLIIGLDLFHTLGIAHQDIKLDNVMYDIKNKKYKYIDWGLNCIKNLCCDKPCGYTGTVDYTSPEKLEWHKKNSPDFKTLYDIFNKNLNFSDNVLHDVWSLGILLLSWYTDTDSTTDDYELVLNKFVKDKTKNKLAQCIIPYMLVKDKKTQALNWKAIVYIIKLLKDKADGEPYKADEPEPKLDKNFKPMLAENLDKVNIDPTGWWVSEKLDGVRSVFVNGKFISRNNNVFSAPQWFINEMPKGVILDGELYTKRNDFNNVISIVRKKVPVDSEWKKIKYMVFDLVDSNPFEKRLEKLQNIIGKSKSKHIELIPYFKATGLQDIEKLHKEITSKGAEGLMLRAPNSYYKYGRTKELLKMKEFNDDEAIVIGYELGEGKYKNVMGNLKVKWLKGEYKNVEFLVGSGFNDEQRSNYKKLFPIGTIIKIKYFQINKTGKPRFPIFIGIRDLIDIDIN
jgi:DNA ligase 1